MSPTLSILEELRLWQGHVLCPLTYRSGGGAWIGIQDPGASSNLKTWAINGIPDTWGPKTVLQWLQSVNWEIQGQPSPPRSGKQVWQIHAKHPKDDSREHYSSELQIGGVTRNILIKRWQKHRSVEQGSKITGPKWWSADSIENDPIEVFDTQPIPPTILDDTQMEDSGENNGENGKTKPEHTSGEPPEKKRVKLWKEPPAAAPKWKVAGGQRGPGSQTALLDLGGDGDCGWRVVSYMVAMQNCNGKKILPLLYQSGATWNFIGFENNYLLAFQGHFLAGGVVS